MENHITQVLSQGAAEKFANQKNKTFQYRHFDSDYNEISSGRCQVLSRTYNLAIDCDVLTYRDLDTNEVRIADQFHLNLA